MEERAGWRGRLHRWRWAIAAIVLVVAVRVALPPIVRRVIVWQATKNLRADVDLGNVNLYLWRGGVDLEDFALRPLPTTSDNSSDNSSATPSTKPERQPPIVAFKRLSIGLRFRPLWDKTIQLYQLSLEGPEIALDRLQSGQLNLQTILPPPTPAADSSQGTPQTAPSTAQSPAANPPAAAEGSGWRFGIDHVALGEGRLIFRDLMIQGAEPVEIHIPNVEVDNIALNPQVYGEPLSSRVKILLDNGSLDVAARLRLAGDTMNLEAEVVAANLPLQRSRLYIPNVGWSDLHGLLDADLEYKLETGKKNEVRGSLSLKDIAVAVPDLPEAALEWKNLTVKVDPVDLVAHSATVTDVDLSGAILSVRATGENRLPILERAKAIAAAAATPSPSPPPTPEGATASATPVEAQSTPFHWSLAALKISDFILRRLGNEKSTDIGVGLDVTNLHDHGEEPGTVDLLVKLAGGSVEVRGNARVDPPGFGGTVALHDLSVPDVIAASGAIAESPLQSAKLDADLSIAAGLAPPDASGGAIAATDLRVAGKLTLANVDVIPPGTKDLTVDTRAIGLVLEKVELPGALDFSATPPTGKGDLHFQGELSLDEPKVALGNGKELSVGAKNIKLAVAHLDALGLIAPSSSATPPAGKGDVHFRGELSLDEPKIAQGNGKEFSVGAKNIKLAVAHLDALGFMATSGGATRTADVALSELRLDAPFVVVTRTSNGLVLPTSSEAPAATTSTSSPTPPAEQKANAPSSSAPTIKAELAAFNLNDGRVDVVDRTTKPPFNGALTALDIQARDIRWPDLAAKDIRLKAHTPGNGSIGIEGQLASVGEGTVHIDLKRVDLPWLNPYAVAYSPFRIAGGALTLSTKASFKGDTYDIGNSITLHDLDLSSKEGQSVFEDKFGVPLSTALALLRDGEGNIVMDIPVKIDRSGTNIDIWAIVSGALEHALLNALTSPLRLLGAVAGGGGKPESIAPAAIAFRPGRPEPAADAQQRLEQLANFLATRPNLGVELETQATQIDLRWLEEQALRQSWAEQGFFSSLASSVFQGDARQRIQQALTARAEDKKGELSEEDSKTLDTWLADRPPIPPEQLTALATERLKRAQDALRSNSKVDATRVITLPPPAELGDGEPEVRVRLKPATPQGTAAPPAPSSPDARRPDAS